MKIIKIPSPKLTILSLCFGVDWIVCVRFGVTNNTGTSQRGCNKMPLHRRSAAPLPFQEKLLRATSGIVSRWVFLISREMEVIDMMDTLFNEEQVLDAYGTEKYNEGLDKGRNEGITEGVLRTLKNLMATLGLTAEKALSASGVPESEWKYYLPQLR